MTADSEAVALPAARFVVEAGGPLVARAVQFGNDAGGALRVLAGDRLEYPGDYTGAGGHLMAVALMVEDAKPLARPEYLNSVGVACPEVLRRLGFRCHAGSVVTCSCWCCDAVALGRPCGCAGRVRP